MGLKGATVSGCLTGKFSLNFRPDVNDDYHAIPLKS